MRWGLMVAYVKIQIEDLYKTRSYALSEYVVKSSSWESISSHDIPRLP
jgi:hypothetical protein